MSKRKIPAVPESRAAGKQRFLAVDDPQDPSLDSDVALADVLEGLADDDGPDIGSDALLDGMGADADDDGIQRALERGLEDDDDFSVGVDDDEADDAAAAAAVAEEREQREAAAVAAEAAQAIADAEVELPLEASVLETSEELDLSAIAVSASQVQPLFANSTSLPLLLVETLLAGSRGLSQALRMMSSQIIPPISLTGAEDSTDGLCKHGAYGDSFPWA